MTATEFSIAAAQSSSVSGDIAANVRHHVELVELAANHDVDVIVFPELSLTGYLPDIAADVAIAADDDKLHPLRLAAAERHITILAGCPVVSHENRPFIGTFIIAPSRQTDVYRKRFVHPDEDPFFVSGDKTVIRRTGGQRIGVAICADIHNEKHSADVAKAGADIYAAGVAISPDGIDRAHDVMAQYATSYGLVTIMANYSEDTGGFQIAGQSAIWAPDGNLLAMAKSPINECLVIARSKENQWTGEVVACQL